MPATHAGPRVFSNRAYEKHAYLFGVAAATPEQGHSEYFPNPFVSQT
jgi:hypothetical protein